MLNPRGYEFKVTKPIQIFRIHALLNVPTGNISAYIIHNQVVWNTKEVNGKGNSIWYPLEGTSPYPCHPGQTYGIFIRYDKSDFNYAANYHYVALDKTPRKICDIFEGVISKTFEKAMDDNTYHIHLKVEWRGL